VCSELGLGQAFAARHNAFYGQGSGEIWLDDLNCVGTERSIVNCPHRGWGIENCGHSENAGVKCITGNFNPDIQQSKTSTCFHLYFEVLSLVTYM